MQKGLRVDWKCPRSVRGVTLDTPRTLYKSLYSPSLSKVTPRAESVYYSKMERTFEFEPEHFYHIYNRGVEKRNIFLDDNDRQRFQDLLYLANGDKPIVFKRVRGVTLDRDRGRSEERR